MASATGIPDLNAARGAGEDEPLLGRRGDAAQVEGETIWKNLWLGVSSPCYDPRPIVVEKQH
jgi:hypothetical protein